MSAEPRVELPADERVVRVLENALAAAREGRLRVVACVAIDSEGVVHTGMGGEDKPMHLLGALDIARHRIITRHVGNDD